MAVKWVEHMTGKGIDAVLAEQGKSRDPNAFTDTTDSDILAAFALDITSGVGNDLFNPTGEINREQAAAMIRNTCRAAGMDISNIAPAGFADIGTAAGWAVDGINFVRNNGIMSGTGNDNFSPKAPYTREQSIITFSNVPPTLTPMPETPPAPPTPPATPASESSANALRTVVQQGEWVYFCSLGGIWKAPVDNMEDLQNITEDLTGGIIVIGDWIYYVSNRALTPDELMSVMVQLQPEDRGHLYKIRTDGTGKQRIGSDNGCHSVSVADDWIYYMTYIDHTHVLYRIRTDGTGRQKLVDGDLRTPIVAGGWIYYEGNPSGLYKIRTDGTDGQLISNERFSSINVVGDWVYYKHSEHNSYEMTIHKIRTDGTGNQKFSDEGLFTDIYVFGEWIYYANNNGIIYRTRTDGTGRQIVFDGSNFLNEYGRKADYIGAMICVAGEWIYFSSANELHRVRADGTGVQTIMNRGILRGR